MSRRIAVAVLACLAAAHVAEAGRKSKEPPTLAELARRTAPVTGSPIVDAVPAQAAQGYEAFLEIEGADPALRAQALRRLGDLRLAEADGRAAAGDEVVAAGDAARAIEAYQQLLEEQPDYAGTDAVLYQLARAREITGDAAGAMATLDRLVADHPGGVHYAEAQFRRGETFFSAQRYADAERAYGAVLAQDRDASFHQQSRYKLGWSLFKQSRDEESSAAFLRLLDDVLVLDGRLRPATDLSRPEQEISDDALRALAITFAAAEGPVTLQGAVARHGATVYEPRLYQALGDLYVEKERYQDGAEAYRAFARARPMDREAPPLLVRATEAYAKGGFTSLVLDGKRELVSQYGPRSAWWSAQGDSLDPAVAGAVQSSLLDLAQHHHALAQKSGSAADRDEAVRWYRDYLEGFDDSPQAPATRLLLADLLFEGTRYEEAAGEYERAAYGYAGNAEAGRAGYAALVSYDKAEAAAPEAARAGLRSRSIESSLRFADTFPDRSEVPGVLTRTCKALFDVDDRERAEAVAQRVLALGARADAGQQLVAWTVLAHTYFDSARYPDAERAYAELSRRLPADDPLRGEVTERLAASVYRQAEAKQAAGDTAGAVNEFLRVAQVAPGSPARAAAEYDAATLLIKTGAWNDAARVLEAFRRDHPEHGLQPEVTRKLAVAYLEGGRKRDAAVELERVATLPDEPEDVRRTARWQAAELYAESADVAAARRAYAAYVEEFPAPFDAAVEARHELASLAGKAGDSQDRARWLAALVEADAAAGGARTDRSRLLAAEASLEIARPLDAGARSVRLAIPLERSLPARKQALEAALKAYGRSAEYGIAPVTTAASYAMADLYRDFGRALLDSERPKDLDAEELEQYDLLLEEQAFPFEEKAIGLHERNAQRAAEGLYDEWVRKSYAALAELMPGRYARVERDGGADAGPLEASALEQVATAEPANAAELNRLGIAYRQAGRFADARGAYERAIVADPLYAEPERNLAVLLDLYLRDATGALSHYERYQQLTAESDPQVKAWLVELRTRLGGVTRTAEAAVE